MANNCSKLNLGTPEYDPLSREEELFLFYNNNFNNLLKHNLRGIRDIATWIDYSIGQQYVCDLISLGSMVFLKQIKSYDPDKGTRIFSYLFPYIKGEMMMYVRDQHQEQMIHQSGGDPDNYPDDNADLIKQMDAQLLHERVDALPERYAFIINSLFFNNLSRTEVADILRVDPTRISQLKYEAFRMLREVL